MGFAVNVVVDVREPEKEVLSEVGG